MPHSGFLRKFKVQILSDSTVLILQKISVIMLNLIIRRHLYIDGVPPTRDPDLRLQRCQTQGPRETRSLLKAATRERIMRHSVLRNMFI